jgi:hypothetical protein
MGFLDSAINSATSAVSQATKVVSNAGLASALGTVNGAIGGIQKAAANGISNLGTALTSAIPGQIAGIGGALGQIQQQISNIVDLGNLNKAINSSATSVNLRTELPMTNILHSYASYNYIFTLSVLDPVSINFPNETYKKGQLGQVILKSASGDPENRVKTEYGKFDFFMDNLSVTSVINLDKDTGNTNATKLTFKVTEIYSMGLFFESLQIAAQAAGYQNYMDVPLLLTIEFKGHLNSAQQGISADSLSIEHTTKHFPLKLQTIDMKVTGRGAEYDVSAYPWNEKGFSSSYLELKTDITIRGKTVHEMLQTGERSLQVVLNERLNDAAKKKGIVKVPDQILIMFPSDLTSGAPAGNDDDGGSATQAPNTGAVQGGDLQTKLKISLKAKDDGGNGTLVQQEDDMNSLGRASMGFTPERIGDASFAKDGLVYDEKSKVYTRGNIAIDPTEGTFKFSQGTDIPNAINQVMLMSDYGRQALTSTQTSDTGKIPWWRIEAQIYTIPSDANLGKTGVMPKLVVYRIVPFGIDASSFMPPNTVNPKVAKAKKQAVKAYNYIYTAKNLDVLNFDIKFKAAFYSAMSADAGINNEGTQRAKESSGANAAQDAESAPPETGSNTVLAGEATKEVRSDVIRTDTGTGTSGRETPETRAAREFQNNVLNNPFDMVNTTITILGDPYYLGDSGMGNYTAAKSQYENMTADYSIDYQTGEVDITVDFRTPIDLDMSKGAYTFGPTKLINQFSGLYQVTRVENTFNRGRFTQTLTLIRRAGQTSDPSADTGGVIKLIKDTQDVIPAVADGATGEGELRTQEEIQASTDLPGSNG